jgi:hypothetical protein
MMQSNFRNYAATSKRYLTILNSRELTYGCCFKPDYIRES